MPNTRQDILDLLKEQGPCTVQELAAFVALTPMSVRHHLQGLLEAGLIDLAGQAPALGAGRPQQMYQAFTPAADSALAAARPLLAALLAETQTLLGPEELLNTLLRLAESEATPTHQRLAGLPLERRMREGTAHFSRLGHQSQWQRDGDAYVVHGYNCPYHPLADRFPQLCQMDAHLVGRIIGVEALQVASIPQSDGRCSFRLALVETHPPVAKGR
ncbi:MAG: ArsR family transcriptional regulator [Chloroflexi bacterium]|nr:ArsR family transcriptional regulator [Chloroflexota bacterium]